MRDFDGSRIVILTALEGMRVFEYLYDISQSCGLDEVEMQLAAKIARDLDLEPIPKCST